MKVSDIKGDVGKRASYWVTDYINNLIFDEIKMVAPNLKFHDHIQLWRMEDFKKLLSGKRIGFPTHGCEAGEIPWRSWVMYTIQSTYNREPVTVDIQILDVLDPNGLFDIEVDLVDKYKNGGYWEVLWSIKANKDLLMAKLSSMFDKDVEKIKATIHKDIKGQELKVGDIICYSTTYSNSVHLGTIDKFNDCGMVVDGHTVSYDAGVLVVNKEIQYNKETKHYEHR